MMQAERLVVYLGALTALLLAIMLILEHLQDKYDADDDATDDPYR